MRQPSRHWSPVSHPVRHTVRCPMSPPQLPVSGALRLPVSGALRLSASRAPWPAGPSPPRGETAAPADSF